MRLLPGLALVLATGPQPQEHPFKESHSLNLGKVSHVLLGAYARCKAVMSQGAMGSSGGEDTLGRRLRVGQPQAQRLWLWGQCS